MTFLKFYEPKTVEADGFPHFFDLDHKFRRNYGGCLTLHYTTAVAEDGKSWFSDRFFLGKGMILRRFAIPTLIAPDEAFLQVSLGVVLHFSAALT